MDHKKIFKIIAVVILAFTLIFIIFGISGKGKGSIPTDFSADGQGMISIRFNKENKKVLEVRSAESQRAPDDKLLLKNIEATIFKEGHLNKDIKISGKSGVVENNFYNFTISNGAKIDATDLSAHCNSFDIIHREVVKTSDKVDYRLKHLKGVARKGMRLNIKKNFFILYDTVGVYKTAGKSYNYKTNFLRFDDLERSLRMRDGSKIDNKETILKGNQILLQFTEEYRDAAAISSWGKCYFYLQELNEKGVKEFKEARAGHIKNTYNQGNMSETFLQTDVRIRLKTELNTTNVSSNEIKISYDEKTGKIKTMSLPKPSNIRNSGKKNFKAKAYKMDVEYDKNGEISTCKSRGESSFTIDNYTGTSFLMTYDVAKNQVALRGKGSKIVHKKNSFESTRFDVDTEEKKIVSDMGVLSIIQLDAKKSNVLFSKDLIYINAKKIEVADKEGKFTYEGDVELHQKTTILKADKLTIDGENNLVASGEEDVSLVFKDKEDEVTLKGKEIIFDAQNRKVEIRRGAVESKGNILRARLLSMEFDKENEINEINGEEKVDFIKEQDDITGSSEKVKWLFKNDEIIFLGDAQIQRKDRGTTKGDELQFFLKDNRILVTSGDNKRTETIIDKKKED